MYSYLTMLGVRFLTLTFNMLGNFVLAYVVTLDLKGAPCTSLFQNFILNGINSVDPDQMASEGAN